jgi:hypothetical protein
MNLSILGYSFIQPHCQNYANANNIQPHTHVLPMTQRHRDITSQGQAIALNIEERLLSYSCMYLPVRQFSDVYNAHYRHFCNVSFKYCLLFLNINLN